MPRETEDFEEGYKSCLARLGHSPEDADKEYQNYMDTVVTKEVILGVVSDLVTDFLYYDRKEDECLPRDAIEKAIHTGVIKPEEVVDAFAKAFYKGVE
jgi:hypothetical protein